MIEKLAKRAGKGRARDGQGTGQRGTVSNLGWGANRSPLNNLIVLVYDVGRTTREDEET